MADTAARLLQLLSLLQSQQHWPGAALSGRLGVGVRTVRADVHRLRDLGYDIDSNSGAAGGYRLRAGTSVPPLLLDDNEALAVAVGLRLAGTLGVAELDDHALGAAAKLERLLPARLSRRLAALTGVAEAAPNSRATVPAGTLTTLAAVCRAGEQLRFDYLDRHGSESRRRVEPHRLVYVSGRWYLVAYDLDRNDWRSFRAERISARTPTGPRFTPRELPGGDFPAFVTQGRMAALWDCRARVLVDAPAQVVAARIPVGSWAVEVLDEETSLLDAGAQTPELLAVYLAALGLGFHVDERAAPELASAVSALAGRCAAAGSG